MIYVDFKGEKLSALGFGTMRLPVIDGAEADIDISEATEMMEYALDHGVNYIDTAWGYHNGNSETFVGEALKGRERSSFNLASKFPGYDVSNFGRHEEIFAEQLRKCQVDYFDFYLLHNVCETNIEQYLDEGTYHTESFFVDRRERGKIRHLGFSVHGTYDTFLRFVEKYGDDMEFAQIQLNYLDWGFQDAKKKVEWCAAHDMPVWVMEPLRGGYLCKLDDAQMAQLEQLRPGVGAPEWALRWVQTVVPNAVILSGMSSMAQMKANIACFEQRADLDSVEMEAIEVLAAQMTSDIGLPCTKCHYCIPHCPQELDIPRLLELFNEYRSKDVAEGFMAPMAIAALPPEKRPSACIGCGSCQGVCPQSLDIPAALAELADALESKES